MRREKYLVDHIYILYSFNEVFLPDSPLPYRSWGPDLVFQLSNAALVLGLFLAPAPKRCRASVPFSTFLMYLSLCLGGVGWGVDWGNNVLALAYLLNFISWCYITRTSLDFVLRYDGFSCPP